MLRFENLADSFDPNAKTQSVNITEIINALWQSANLPDTTIAPFTVTEKSITGSQDLKMMNENRLHWKTVDDDKLVKKDLSFDLGDIIILEPQRIRVFLIQLEE